MDHANQSKTAAIYGQASQIANGPPLTHTEATTNSLQNLLGTLNDSNGWLQEARDRMFGCQPDLASGVNPKAVPNGRADEIEMMLSACHAAAERNQTLASELLRRL